MALLFMDGFDAGDYVTKYSSVAAASGFSSSTVTRFSQGTSLLRGSNTSGQLWRKITASQTVICGFAGMYTTNYSGFPATLLMLSSDNTVTDHISLVTGDSPNTLVIRRGSTALFTASVSQNEWHFLELKATVDSVAGNVELRVDGVQAGVFTGNTRNGGTNTNIDTLKLIGSGNATGISIYWDDLYVCDALGTAPYNTFLGDVRVSTLTPSGAGTTTGFTPLSGANYTNVDEIPYNPNDYVTASASGTRDSYAMSDLSGSYTVLGVQNNIIAKKIDAGGTAIKSVVVSGGTTSYGTSQVLTSNDTTFVDVRTTDPATTIAWTISGVNAIEAGMEIA